MDAATDTDTVTDSDNDADTDTHTDAHTFLPARCGTGGGGVGSAVGGGSGGGSGAIALQANGACFAGAKGLTPSVVALLARAGCVDFEGAVLPGKLKVLGLKELNSLGLISPIGVCGCVACPGVFSRLSRRRSRSTFAPATCRE
jgi:hypothetical protein